MQAIFNQGHWNVVTDHIRYICKALGENRKLRINQLQTLQCKGSFRPDGRWNKRGDESEILSIKCSSQVIFAFVSNFTWKRQRKGTWKGKQKRRRNFTSKCLHKSSFVGNFVSSFVRYFPFVTNFVFCFAFISCHLSCVFCVHFCVETKLKLILIR